MVTELHSTAREMVGRGRGILAVDASPTTVSRHNRRAYREMLVTTPALCSGISGVTLSGEAFGQRLDDGRTFPRAVTDLGMLAGVTVDTGHEPLAGAPGETVTEGLDGLRPRLAGYADRGARFAQWRAAIRIGQDLPSERALRANAHALARYAALCQEAGMVPIVSPEVLADSDHDQGQCAGVTAVTLLLVMRELGDAGVDLTGTVLEPNMVVPGALSGQRADPSTIASETVAALRSGVPEGLAGIAFLPGGQSPEQATANLAALQHVEAPWPLTFSFGRALIRPALDAWRGEPTRVRHGQRELAGRVMANAAVMQGRNGSYPTAVPV